MTKNLVVITNHWRGETLNVDLYVPNGTRDGAMMSISKAFDEDPHEAYRIANKAAELYRATIEDRSSGAV